MLLIYLCTFMGALVFYQPVGVLYLGSRGLNITQVLSLESVLLVGMLLSEVPSGYLSDIIGCKWIMVLGFLCAAVSQLIYAVASGFAQFAVSSAFFGVSIACLSGARDVYIMGHLERLGLTDVKHVGDVYGRVTAMSLVAGVVSSLAGAQMATISLALPAVVTAIASVLALFTALLLPKPPRTENSELHLASSWLAALRDVLRSPMLMFFAVTPTYALFASINSVAQVKLTRYHTGVGWFGIVFAVSTLLAAGASSLTGRLGQRWGTGKVHGVAILGAGVAYLFGALPGGPTVIIAAVVLVAVCMNIRLPVSYVIMNAHVVPAMRATMLSMVGLISGIVGSLINPAIGYAADKSPNLSLVLVGSALLFIGTVWFFVSGRSARRANGEGSEG
ncbi:MFS transporter [Streptomyces sp. NPDC059679]|uniref:MFS transporter n=1 Tax=Streptomyces sp. NPDC059679 TaxID=3346903 RepID=UPI00368B0328